MKVAHHKSHEEVERGGLQRGDEARAVPEDERDDAEWHRLRHGPEQVAVKRSAVRPLQRFLEALGIEVAAVLFTSERCDGADCTRSFTGKLR